jgi:hypothetical protein
MSSKLSTTVVLSLFFSSAVLGMPVSDVAGTPATAAPPAVKDKVCKNFLSLQSPETLTGRLMVAIQPNKVPSAGKRRRDWSEREILRKFYLWSDHKDSWKEWQSPYQAPQKETWPQLTSKA